VTPANPFVRLFEAPTETLTAAAYALVLVGLVVLSWWALGRNLLYLREQYRDGWQFLVPLGYAGRVASACGLIAVDLWLVAAIIAVLTP
jgi:hypothetical protein